MAKIIIRFAMPIMIVLLLGCVSTQQMQDSSTIVSIAGTTWSRTDSDGDYYEYHFQTNGALYYNSPTGSWKNGTWKQMRNGIYMETNNRFSESQGVILGNRMMVLTWNIMGHWWIWVAEKK